MHVVASPHRGATLAGVVLFAHLIGVGLWIGAIAGATVTLARPHDHTPAGAQRILRRTALLAEFGAVAVIGGGLLHRFLDSAVRPAILAAKFVLTVGAVIAGLGRHRALRRLSQDEPVDTHTPSWAGPGGPPDLTAAPSIAISPLVLEFGLVAGAGIVSVFLR